MIKNLGGVFGRNPTFNNVEVEGDLAVDGNYVVAGDIAVTGNATITGTLGVTGQITGAAGLKLEDAALNTTIFSQDNTTSKQLQISSYYSGSAAQFPWLKNDSGDVITIGDLNATNFPMSTVWDCENGSIYSSVGDSSIYIDSAEVSINGVFSVNTATGNINADLSTISASALTAINQVKGATISTGSSLVIQGTGTLTTTAITQVTLLSLSSTTYSSVKYFIQARNTTTSRFQITEIVATRNATTTVVTATPVNTNTGGIACTTYAVDISGGNFRLLATPQAASSTIFKVLYTAIP
jgi:hypothetical protein